jgi:hypothetical protein
MSRPPKRPAAVRSAAREAAYRRQLEENRTKVRVGNGHSRKDLGVEPIGRLQCPRCGGPLQPDTDGMGRVREVCTTGGCGFWCPGVRRPVPQPERRRHRGGA